MNGRTNTNTDCRLCLHSATVILFVVKCKCVFKLGFSESRLIAKCSDESMLLTFC